MKKLRVFDFDDTLVYTECRVIVKRNGELYKVLSTHEFAVYVPCEEDEFDYSEFLQVRNPTVNSDCMQHFLRIVNSGLHDKKKMAILTARGTGAKPAIKKFLTDLVGKDNMKRINIITLNSSNPDDKKKWIEKTMINRRIHQTVFYDDSGKNRDSVHSLNSRFKNKKVIVVDPHPEKDQDIKKVLSKGAI